MPLYEYFCSNCELSFDVRRPYSEAGDAAPCPKCHKSAERKLSRVACFSVNELGQKSSITDKWCASCGATNCGTCPLKSEQVM